MGETGSLLSKHPDFDPESYAAAIPYRCAGDRGELLAALRTALRSATEPNAGGEGSRSA